MRSRVACRIAEPSPATPQVVVRQSSARGHHTGRGHIDSKSTLVANARRAMATTKLRGGLYAYICPKAAANTHTRTGVWEEYCESPVLVVPGKMWITER